MTILRTSISAPFLRRRLLIGSAIALPGIALMIGANFLRPEPLQSWGLPIAIVSIGLIALGLIPYRRLCHLQLHPDHLEIDQDGITYYTRGAARFRLPIGAIRQLTHVESQGRYGIGITLSADEKIVVVDPKFDMARFLARSKRTGCDLFLPYFSKRALRELENA